ncbi:MAG: 50S ribosomal protein L16 [Clostridia bacterium]|nr:50S ribosomal protein L16 [Clostridia bacterium]MDD4386415.1 50S ribosomal protein L16 [Clostridia bacterium]
MLSPKRTKYRKVQKGNMKGRAQRGNKVSDGEYGLQSMEAAWITANQIESARIVLSRYTKKVGKTWIKIFPDKPITKKPAETRMGSGKGNPEYFVAVVKPDRVIFEIAGVDEVIAKKALTKAMHKLPVKCKIIKREVKVEETIEGGIQNEV